MKKGFWLALIAGMMMACSPKSDCLYDGMTFADERMERGVKQAAALWRAEDGSKEEFQAFVAAHYAQTEEERDALFESLSRVLERLNESADMLTVELLKPTQLTNAGEPTEIEFEHGGTESAVEIEEEEGGEYESEIERGGEVALEQFWLQKAFNRYAIIRAGMQVVPVGALNAHHESTEYFGVYRNEGEFTIMPSTWHEIALTFMGSTKNGWHYQAMFLPGLDSDRFNRKNWIKPGAGSPYEFKLANVFAGAARVDYTGVPGLRLSLSGYCGNSFRNTLSMSNSELDASAYKDVKGTVSIGSFDFAYKGYGVIVRGSATYGHLNDAAAITQYNISMRKGSVSSKQWVASDAVAAGIEAGYDFFSLNKKLVEKKQQFYVFCRYDYYDSMLRYDNQPTDMYAWCGRHRIAAGINYFPIKQIGVKAEFSYGILKQGTRADGTRGKLYNDEPQIAVGIVYAGFYELNH